MASIAYKLIGIFSKMFRLRYNIFCGTNTWVEWGQVFRHWILMPYYENSDVITIYENKFAEICCAKHGISFGAGRMALYAILEALDIGEGDEVIIPAFTCVVVPNAIIYRGARPVYVDIEPKFFNIDVSKVEAAITSRTKALCAQHTFGIPCDVEVLRQIGHRYGLPVIEDCSHALGALYQGKPVGSLTEVAFFSTDHSKVINTHLGGMVVTNSHELASRLRKIQSTTPFLNGKMGQRLIQSFLIEFILFLPSVLWLGSVIHSILLRLKVIFFFRGESKTERPKEYPYPCRLSSTQARLGLLQIEKLDQNLSHRREIANYLEGKVQWNQVSFREVNQYSWLRYSFLVEDRTAFEALFRKHFDLGIWFTSVVEGRSKNLEKVGYRLGSCPVAEYVAQHIVNFPTHPRIPIQVIQNDVNKNLDCFISDIVRRKIDGNFYEKNVPNRMAEHTVL